MFYNACKLIQLKRLAKGVELYQEQGWNHVAEFVGGSITANQCAHRWRAWRAESAPTQKYKRKWSTTEVNSLLFVTSKIFCLFILSNFIFS